MKQIYMRLVAVLSIAVLLGTICLPVTPAYGLTFKAIQDIRNYKPWYDKNDTTAPCVTEGGVVDPQVSSDRIKTSYEFFAANGYTPQQSAGIVGNLMLESGYNKDVDPTNWADNGDGGYGIAQFTPASKMRIWVIANGEDPDSLLGQLHYLKYVLEHEEAVAGQAVKATSTVQEATIAFETKYERPAAEYLLSSQPQRIKNANAVYAKYGGSADATPTSSSGCVSNSSSPNCETATGNAKILCEAKKYEGIYYLWAGGHDSVAFHIACTPEVLARASSTSTASDPGPCATDCSGLVSISTSEAFGKNYSWSVETLQHDSANWQRLGSISQALPGDVVTFDTAGGRGEHVEIVDHITDGRVVTFGSHAPGTKTGPQNSVLSDWDGGAYRFIGAKN